MNTSSCVVVFWCSQCHLDLWAVLFVLMLAQLFHHWFHPKEVGWLNIFFHTNTEIAFRSYLFHRVPSTIYYVSVILSKKKVEKDGTKVCFEQINVDFFC